MVCEELPKERFKGLHILVDRELEKGLKPSISVPFQKPVPELSLF